MANGLAVVLAAAGTGSRMNSDINKQFILLNLRPVISYSLDLFERIDEVDEVVIVAHPQEVEYCEKQIVAKSGYTKVKGVFAGGATRQESVWNGMQKVNNNTRIIAIHDGARPLVTEALLLDLVKIAENCGAAIPGIAPRDSLKLVDGEGFVNQSLDRTMIVAAQTPQVFDYRQLFRAYELARAEAFEATDDAALFERYIGRVKVVPGNYRNLKITTREDLMIAESYLRSKEEDK